MAEHKIILASVAPGSEAAVTTALAEVLGLSEDGVRPLVSSVPIILLDGLDAGQGQAIVSAMASAKEAGGNLIISATSGENMPHVDWPSPPKVAGRDVASFASAAGADAAPETPGSGIRRAVATPARPPDATPPTPSPSEATITCPHCSKPIALHASAADPGARAGISQVPVSQALAAPVPPVPAAEEAAGVGRALPEVPDVQGNVETPPQPAGIRTSPMDLEEFERGVGGGGPPQQPGGTLLQQLDKALRQPAPQPQPKSKPKVKLQPKKPPSPSSGHPGRARPRSPGAASDRLRGRDRKRRR